MADAKLLWFDFGADIQLGKNNDLMPENGLYNAVLISPFTDSRAPIDAQLPQDETSRRGWWPDTATQKTGSLLWLVEREKTLPEVADRAREYCQEALAWMVDEGIAQTVEVAAELKKPFGLQIKIKISRGTSRQYAYLWDAMSAEEVLQAGNTSIKLQFD